MALFTGWASKVIAFLTQNVGATAIVLSKDDLSPDLLLSNGKGASRVSDSTTAVSTLGAMTMTIAAVQLPAAACQLGVRLCADSANTGIVNVGGAGVTVLTGMQLPKGEPVALPCSDASLYYALSTVAGDKLRILAV